LFYYLPKNVQPHTPAVRFSIIRKFAVYWKNIDINTEVPPKNLLPYSYRRKTPYIYTDIEEAQILLACGSLNSILGLRKHTYFTLFGLIACTGLRKSEAIFLDNSHVDFDQAVLIIERSKFNKSRIIPIHSTVLNCLKNYEKLRNQLIPLQKDNSFFLSEKGTRLKECAVNNTFVKVSKIAGIRKQTDRHGPRIHDLRHSFAVKAIIKCFKTKINVDRRIPILSNYLGHVSPISTYWYLSSVPELMTLVANQLSKTKDSFK